MRIPEYIKRNYITINLVLIVYTFSLLLYNNLLHQTFWYDEAYTIALVKYSYTEILEITSSDVHPPLYYFMLKSFCSIFGDSLVAMRIFSNLGVIASMLLVLFFTSKPLTKVVSTVFILFIAIMPVNQYMGVEIRMYSWAMFFVLASAIYGYKAYDGQRLSAHITLTIFSVCAAYTHYYALLSVGIIYLLLILFITRKSQKSWNKLFISILLFVILYAYWIPVLFSQILTVQKNFWIEPITTKDILLFCYYFFSPKEPTHPYTIFTKLEMSIALSIALLVITGLIFQIIHLHSNRPNQGLKTAVYFISIYIITLFITFLISFTIQPISFPRYTCCALGPLLFGISIFIVELWKENKKIFVISTMVLLCIFSTTRFFSEKAYYLNKNEEKAVITNYLNSNKDIETIGSSYQSYPALAELSLIFPNKDFIIYSPKQKTDFRPFNIHSSNKYTNTNELYWVKAIYDSTHINNNYRIVNKLEIQPFTVYLLNKTPE